MQNLHRPNRTLQSLRSNLRLNTGKRKHRHQRKVDSSIPKVKSPHTIRIFARPRERHAFLRGTKRAIAVVSTFAVIYFVCRIKLWNHFGFRTQKLSQMSITSSSTAATATHSGALLTRKYLYIQRLVSIACYIVNAWVENRCL